MDLATWLAVFGLAFVTMFLGALSGGVGLVTRPLLILLGYTPQIVIGTSRASAIAGELPGVVILYKSKKSTWATTRALIIPILLGTIAAAVFALRADNAVLRYLIGVIVLGMVVFLLLKRDVGEKELSPRYSPRVRGVIAFLGSAVIAFLSTLSGGLGILYTALYAWLYGKTYLGAAAMWRIAGYLGGLAGSVIFIVKGVVDWQLLVPLALGFMLGSYFGTHFGLKRGEKWTKYLVLVVATASAVKLLAG